MEYIFGDGGEREALPAHPEIVRWPQSTPPPPPPRVPPPGEQIIPFSVVFGPVTGPNGTGRSAIGPVTGPPRTDPRTGLRSGPPTGPQPGPRSGPPTGPQTGPQVVPQTGPQTGPQAGPRTGPTRTGPPGPATGPLALPPVDTGPLDLYQPSDLGGPAFGPGASKPVPAFQPNRRRRRGSLLRPRRAIVSVDNNRCHLYAICQMEAPASFLVARDGRLYYDAAPPSHLMPNVRQAARLCPMQAIDVGNG
jgi:ferredoxin